MKMLLRLLFCLLFLAQTGAVFAHQGEEAPFFKVNGTYSPPYAISTASVAGFLLPLDQGPKNYLVGEPINFVIDSNSLGVSQDVIEQTRYTWDFGDGTFGVGGQTSHVYKKLGSYVLKIDAQYQNVSGAQLFQSIILNILPDTNYKLPKAVMAINGKTPTDPLTDLINIPFGETVRFDAAKSSGGSSGIVSYYWDFGDSKSGTGQTVTHTYDKTLVQQQVFPVLRVKTAAGFIADSFAEIDNKGVASVSKVSRVSRAFNYTWVVGAGLVILVGGGIFLRRKRRGKR